MTGKTSTEWVPARARAVPGFSGYFVMDDGTMRGPARKVMRPMRAKSGHRYIIENLAWGTRQENADDTRKHGRLKAARRVGPSAKLTSDQVAEIRRRNVAHDGRLGESIRSLAREYGVSHTTVRKIVIGEKWA